MGAMCTTTSRGWLLLVPWFMVSHSIHTLACTIAHFFSTTLHCIVGAAETQQLTHSFILIHLEKLLSQLDVRVWDGSDQVLLDLKFNTLVTVVIDLCEPG